MQCGYRRIVDSLHPFLRTIMSSSTTYYKPPHRRSRRNPPPPSRPLPVYTSDFGAMHQKCQDDGMRAPIKYKVHKPGCSCSKLRTKLKSGNFQFVEQQQQQQQQQQDTIIDDNDNNTSLDDGLIMHPDAKGIPCIFFWRNSENVFAEDPRLAESELQNQIDVAAAAAAVVSSSSFKVTCAACLLEDEPNGFACVSSSSEEVIHLVRDWTRKLAAKTPMDQRASDHGDFVLTLPRHLLEKLKKKKEQKKKKDSRTSTTTTALKEEEDDDSIRTITDQIVAHMTQQNVPIPHEETREGVELKLGHHLDALLQLTSSSKEEDDSTTSSNYWLLYGDDDSSCTDAAPASVMFELNIPGGKRHLGETCLQAAIRETQEETSLIWDERWIVQEYQNHHHPFEKINRYYMLHPPDPAALSVAVEQEDNDEY
jgi:hypothetical protein